MGERSGDGEAQQGCLCSFRLKKRNVMSKAARTRPIEASFPRVDFPPSPSWLLRNGTPAEVKGLIGRPGDAFSDSGTGSERSDANI